MRCIRCGKDVPNDVRICDCGFHFDDVANDELSTWFDETKSVLETAYIQAQTLWQQSGKSGTFEEWTRLRIPVAEAMTTSGTFLDIGCANGFMIECILQWTAHKNISIEPYGLDFSPALIELAKKRLPEFTNNLFVGNALDWQTSDNQQFDYVRTSLEYVPVNYYQQALDNAYSLVKAGGKLLVAQYRSRKDDLSRDWIDEEVLPDLGYTAAYTTHGYSSHQAMELCRVVVIEKLSA